MPSTRSQCRTATATFLIACSVSACAVPVTIEADCAWARPIKFSEASKAWLAGRVPWPAHLRADLEKVARHNDKYRTFCR